jgi:hypothetical protein
MLTGDMLADRLTKALVFLAFEKFRSQIGVVDIMELLAVRKLKEVTIEALEAVEDYFEGGESTSDPVSIALRAYN